MGKDADSEVGDQRTDAFENSPQRSPAVGIRVTEACPIYGVMISEAVIRRRRRHHHHQQQQHQIYYIWSAFAVLLGHWNLPPPPPL